MIRFKATENQDVIKTPISVIKPQPIDWLMVQYMCVCSSCLQTGRIWPDTYLNRKKLTTDCIQGSESQNHSTHREERRGAFCKNFILKLFILKQCMYVA